MNGFSDTLILYVLVEKLDKNTRSWWERSLKKDEIGTIEQLTSFLKEHSRTLQHNKPFRVSKRPFNSKALTSLSENPSNICTYCSGDHRLFKCNQFLNLAVKKRFNFVKAKNLCINCFSSAHLVNSCKSTNKCRKCSRHHHTFLHFEGETRENDFAPSHSSNSNENKTKLNAAAKIFTPSDSSYTDAIDNKSPAPCTSAMTVFSPTNKQVVLSTAIIYVKTTNDDYIACRSLLDSGSQNNFISKECVELLNLRRKKNTCFCFGNKWS